MKWLALPCLLLILSAGAAGAESDSLDYELYKYVDSLCAAVAAVELRDTLPNSYRILRLGRSHSEVVQELLSNTHVFDSRVYRIGLVEMFARSRDISAPEVVREAARKALHAVYDGLVAECVDSKLKGWRSTEGILEKSLRCAGQRRRHRLPDCR